MHRSFHGVPNPKRRRHYPKNQSRKGGPWLLNCAENTERGGVTSGGSKVHYTEKSQQPPTPSLFIIIIVIVIINQYDGRFFKNLNIFLSWTRNVAQSHRLEEGGWVPRTKQHFTKPHPTRPRNCLSLPDTSPLSHGADIILFNIYIIN